jgi:hypothetical protein
VIEPKTLGKWKLTVKNRSIGKKKVEILITIKVQLKSSLPEKLQERWKIKII